MAAGVRACSGRSFPAFLQDRACAGPCLPALLLLLVTPSTGSLLARRQVSQTQAAPGRLWSRRRHVDSPDAAPEQADARGLDCFGLDHPGFPLPVDDLLKEANYSKKAYFDNLREMGIDQGLPLAAPPGQALEGSCLAKRQGGRRLHVIFIGDCMVRQSFQAFLRNTGQTLPAELHQAGGDDFGEAIQRRLRKSVTGGDPLDMWSSLYSDDRPHPPKQLPKEVRIVRVGDQEFTTINMVNATYVKWEKAPTDVSKLGISRVLEELQIDIKRDSVVIWTNYAVHAVYHNNNMWGNETSREKALVGYWQELRDAFPGVQLIWDSPSFVDMAILTSNPKKPDFEHWVKHDVAARTFRLDAIDERAAREHSVIITPRAWVSENYRGLQCDGIHADPHGLTKSEFWHCYGFFAYEDLTLQGTLHSACRGKSINFCPLK